MLQYYRLIQWSSNTMVVRVDDDIREEKVSDTNISADGSKTKLTIIHKILLSKPCACIEKCPTPNVCLKYC